MEIWASMTSQVFETFEVLHFNILQGIPHLRGTNKWGSL